MKINPIKLRQFKAMVWDFYTSYKRDLPWRKTTEPYHIFVSEMMLQQTQVSRVSIKYREFIKEFPTFSKLSRSPLRSVLQIWQGMGYNRRAKYLIESAKLIMANFAGKLPEDPRVLDTLPGIGHATACSIAAFAFNTPVVFIETNIRRVFIHHFFKDINDVDDTELLPLVGSALDKKNPREWYFALMDYGTYLSKKVTNPNRRSKHYVKQSTFEDSDRRLRGLILKKALNKSVTVKGLSENLGEPVVRIEKILLDLVKEKFITKKGDKFSL